MGADHVFTYEELLDKGFKKMFKELGVVSKSVTDITTLIMALVLVEGSETCIQWHWRRDGHCHGRFTEVVTQLYAIMIRR